MVPTSDPGAVAESGTPVSEADGLVQVRSEDGRAVFEAAAGRYRFTAPLQ
jgi:hypothetical protein